MKLLTLTQVLLILLAAPAGSFVFGCSSPLPSLPPDPGGAYRLDSGDQLRIIVFGQEELTGSYTVDGSGMISMPLIPAVRARGRMVLQDISYRQ